MLDKEFVAEVDNNIEKYLLVNNVDHIERRGKKWFKCVYPDHNDNNPSMTIIPGRNLLKCFGCGKTLNITQAFDIMHPEKKQLSFEDKIEAIAKELDMQVPTNKWKKEDIKLMYEAYADFERFATASKNNIPDKIRNYLSSKKIPISYPDIGYIFDYKEYEAYMRGKYTKEMLDHLSLLGQFRFSTDSLIFFLRDADGHVIASASRYCGNRSDAPKYVNASNSSIYNKSHLLYGMHTIDQVDTVILVEGYSDAVVARANGLPNTLALCGTQLSKYHVAWIEQHVKKGIVLALDGDDAGRQGMIMIAHKYFMTPTTLQIAFASLPDGADPDDVILSRGIKALFNKMIDRIEISEILLKNEKVSESKRDEFVASIMLNADQSTAIKYLYTFARLRKMSTHEAAEYISKIIMQILSGKKADYLDMAKHWDNMANKMDEYIAKFVNLSYWNISGGDKNAKQEAKQEAKQTARRR